MDEPRPRVNVWRAAVWIGGLGECKGSEAMAGLCPAGVAVSPRPLLTEENPPDPTYDPTRERTRRGGERKPQPPHGCTIITVWSWQELVSIHHSLEPLWGPELFSWPLASWWWTWATGLGTDRGSCLRRGQCLGLWGTLVEVPLSKLERRACFIQELVSLLLTPRVRPPGRGTASALCLTLTHPAGAWLTWYYLLIITIV